MSVHRCDQHHEVHCELPDTLAHSTVIVMIQGMQADDQSDALFRDWLEAHYGHVVQCSYGYESFCGDCAARTIARTLKPLRHTGVTLVLVGCSKGFATMCEVFQLLRGYGFPAARISLISPDGARGYENVSLVPSLMARCAPLMSRLPIGPRLSRWPGRLIVNRLLAGRPRQELHTLQQVRDHIVHVLRSTKDLTGASQLVYLAGLSETNGVLHQPAECWAMSRHAASFAVPMVTVEVLGGGHCNFDEQLRVWQSAFRSAFRMIDVYPLPTRQTA